jgi:hypothetical protein
MAWSAEKEQQISCQKSSDTVGFQSIILSILKQHRYIRYMLHGKKNNINVRA